jgi:hypothetical protein
MITLSQDAGNAPADTHNDNHSTIGPETEKARPDQGQPVTSKGDALNPGVDSSTTAK